MKKLTCILLCIITLLSLAVPALADGLTVNVPEYIDTYQGKTVDLYCSASDPLGGELSYIWYSSLTDDMAGMIAVNRGTETADTLSVDTASVGITYYCCLVESSSGNSAYSSIIKVTVYENLSSSDETTAASSSTGETETTTEPTAEVTTEATTEATTAETTASSPAATTTEPTVAEPTSTSPLTTFSEEAQISTEPPQTSAPASAEPPVTSSPVTLPASSENTDISKDTDNGENSGYVPTIGANSTHGNTRFELLLLLTVSILCFVIAAVCIAILIYIIVRKVQKKKKKNKK